LFIPPNFTTQTPFSNVIGTPIALLQNTSWTFPASLHPSSSPQNFNPVFTLPAKNITDLILWSLYLTPLQNTRNGI
jgi:hypothetical protein